MFGGGDIGGDRQKGIPRDLLRGVVRDTSGEVTRASLVYAGKCTLEPESIKGALMTLSWGWDPA